MSDPETSAAAHRPLEPGVRRALLGLTLFLVAFPLVLRTPGWPGGLKSDEPAYYLMAASLAADGDLRCDLGDLRRLFAEFPYHPVHNLILMSDDGWATVYFGKPYLYSLFAAPWAGLFGASGLVAFNMALLVGMVWLGTLHLRRHNRDAVAALFSAGFFLLSVGFAYVFWLHPEVFNMAAVTACLYLGLADVPPAPRGRFGRLLAHPALRAAGSGAALALAVYNKPMLALLGAGVLFAYARRRRLAAVAAWLGGALAATGLVVAVAYALTGHPTSYLGVSRGGFKVCSPHEMPVTPAAPLPTAADEEAELDVAAATDAAAATEAVAAAPPRPRAASWGWIFRVPDVDARELLERFGLFLWGRHTGLFLYFPFSLLALGLFLAHRRRSPAGWAVLASLVAVAVVFLVWIPYNWHGGGGFLGNRYFVNAYPGFLFLVGRVAPAAVTLAGYLLGGLFLGPILFTPLGRSVPWPTLQAHVRNPPFTWFPFELPLKGVPGYDDAAMAGARLRGRDDVFLPRGSRVWIHGGTPVEVWIETLEPRESFLFTVRSPAAPNTVELRLADARARLDFSADDPDPRRVTLRPSRPTKVRSLRGERVWVYRLDVRTTAGEVLTWRRVQPPRDCFYYPYLAETEEPFWVGVELSLLGDPELLERDVFAVDWLDVDAPRRVTAGASFPVRARVRNASRATWPATPPVQVSLAYHWEDAAGGVAEWEGRRSDLPAPVPPGGETTVELLVVAPERPGRHRLVLDAVYEEVAWFSRRGAAVRRVPVLVARPRPADETGGDGDDSDGPTASDRLR